MTKSRDRIYDLERLAQLHKSGALTDDEYNTEKGRILGGYYEDQSLSADAREYAGEILVSQPPVRWGCLASMAAAITMVLVLGYSFSSDPSESNKHAEAEIIPARFHGTWSMSGICSEPYSLMRISGTVISFPEMEFEALRLVSDDGDAATVRHRISGESEGQMLQQDENSALRLENGGRTLMFRDRRATRCD